MRNPDNLRVYQMAIDLNDALAIYHPRYKTPPAEAQRSAESIENNINEGCLRESEREFLNHITFLFRGGDRFRRRSPPSPLRFAPL